MARIMDYCIRKILWEKRINVCVPEDVAPGPNIDLCECECESELIFKALRKGNH